MKITANTLRSNLATASSGIARYPPRKQLTWAQCQTYIQSPIFFLLQIDNLNYSGQLQLKSQLRSLGLSLKTPKAHILAKVLETTPQRCLADSVCGFVGLATSSRPPHELAGAVNMLKSHPNVLLLGGKVLTHSFTAEGLQDIITNIGDHQTLQMKTTLSINSAALVLMKQLEKAQIGLVSLLLQRISLEEDKKPMTSNHI